MYIPLDKFLAQSFRVICIPLLNLPADVLEVLCQGQLEYTKARALPRLTNGEARKQLLDQAIACNVSLKEIKQKIGEIEQKSKPETSSIKNQVDETFHRFKQSKVWDDPKKKVKVEKLLAQLNALIKNAQES